MSISNIYNLSKSALVSSRYAMNTTAKNIANINTEGYTRRRADLSRITAFGFNGQNGENMLRIRQRFVESQLSYENQNLAKYHSDEMIMTQIEGVFGEPNESSLSNVLSEFWNAWNDLANDPESQHSRSLVRDKGIMLANTFNRLNKDLKNLQQQINTDIQNKATQVRQLTGQIHSINEQVGVNMSDDLLDQRDILVDELSTLINVNVRESDNGAITVSSGGQILISGSYLNELAVESSINDGLLNVELSLHDSNRLPNITSGEMGSLLEIHNGQIPDIIEKLDALAVSIAEQVNSVHSNGYNLNEMTGFNFFAANVSGADDFSVSREILEDPSLIATSSTIGTPGDGSIAQAISDIQFDSIVQGNTISDFYNTLISHIGNQVQEAQFLRKSQEMVVQSLQNQRDSVSGVSLDEELANLIEYEQAYQAAARMITSVDEMVQTILNMV
ncbi:MAG: flagellar hook-associated protein FlgK [Candidatus Hatepunaea meridiana]|nr:flagellar hook-associated protein FlgK [Candidatus Hatepunaea meridiana]